MPGMFPYVPERFSEKDKVADTSASLVSVPYNEYDKSWIKVLDINAVHFPDNGDSTEEYYSTNVKYDQDIPTFKLVEVKFYHKGTLFHVESCFENISVRFQTSVNVEYRAKDIKNAPSSAAPVTVATSAAVANAKDDKDVKSMPAPKVG